HQGTEGNPFFVDEVVRGHHFAAGAWQPSSGVPISQGVRGAIRERLAPLSPEHRALLAAAAVIGRDFELWFLASLCDRTPEVMLESLGVPLEREIIARVAGSAGRYRFSHALIRETIYEELPPAHRAALHRRLGQLLEKHYEGGVESPLSELAHHFF